MTREKYQPPENVVAAARALYAQRLSLLVITLETGLSEHLIKRLAKELEWRREPRPMKPHQKSEPTKRPAFDYYGNLPPLSPAAIALAERLYWNGCRLGAIAARVGLETSVIRQLIEEGGWGRGSTGVTRKRRVVARRRPQPSTADLRRDPVPAYRRNYQPSPAGQSLYLSTTHWSEL